MAEALQEVKRLLGSSAVILHTRQYKRGGFLGIGAKTVVEVTAADGQQLGQRARQQRRGGRGKSANGQRGKRAAATRDEAVSPRASTGPGSPAAGGGSPAPSDQEELAGDLIRRTYAAARAEMEPAGYPQAPQDRVETSASAAGPGQPIQTTAGTATTAPQPEASLAPAAAAQSQQQLAQEMEAVKRMVGQVMRQQYKSEAAPAYQTGSTELEQHYLALLEQEVAQEVAAEIVDDVHRRLDANQRQDADTCRRAMLNALTEWLPGEDNANELQPTGDGRPRTIALVGPTGVGKTTTIAKLAATFKIKQNRSVGLVTLDTYRIAAVEQLRTYAGIIGLDLHIASTPDEVERALQRLSDCEVILIDTAGRSQRNENRLDELKQCLEAAQPHETHLVLSSTCSQQVLEQTIERFSCVPTDRIIFTKLDEAVNFGVVLNVANKVKKQLSYITTGQDVPHQIEPGRADRLAELVLGEAEVSP